MMNDFESNYREYFAMYDGTRKELGKKERMLIDSLFHDDVSIVEGGQHKRLSKDMLYKIIETLLKAGRKVEVTHFEYLDDSHFEYKLQVSGEDIVPTHDHYIGTIKDSKLIEVKPFNESSSKLILSQIAIEMAMREFLAIFDGTPRDFTKDDQKLADNFYQNEIIVDAGKKTIITKEQWLDFVKPRLQAGRKAEGLQLKSLDASHFEYKVTFVDQLGNRKIDHSVATYKDGKICGVAPCGVNTEKAQKVLFETTFREYFKLYDGVPKEFGATEQKLFDTVYGDEFTLINGSMKMDKSTWKERVAEFVQSGAKVELVHFEFLDDTRYDYKLHVEDSTDGFKQELHSQGTISNGKCTLMKTIKLEPYEELFSHFQRKKEQGKNESKETGTTTKSYSSHEFKVDKENNLVNA